MLNSPKGARPLQPCAPLCHAFCFSLFCNCPLKKSEAKSRAKGGGGVPFLFLLHIDFIFNWQKKKKRHELFMPLPTVGPAWPQAYGICVLLGSTPNPLPPAQRSERQRQTRNEPFTSPQKQKEHKRCEGKNCPARVRFARGKKISTRKG